MESTIQSQQVWFQNAKPQLCCTICDATPETWTPPTRTMTSTTTPSTTNTTTTTTDKDSSTIPYKWWTRSIKNPKPNQAKNICLCPTCGMGPWHSYGVRWVRYWQNRQSLAILQRRVLSSSIILSLQLSSHTRFLVCFILSITCLNLQKQLQSSTAHAMAH